MSDSNSFSESDAVENDPATVDIHWRKPTPTELPRLRVAHLMAWMAATAVAFLPYQMQISAQARLSPGAMTQSAAMTATWAMYGVAAGSYLFIIAALAYWRRRGYRVQLQPGHWLAIEGACDWMVGLLTWMGLLWSTDSPYGLMPLLMIPRFLKGLVFFFLFMWLALRRGEAVRWRVAFFAFAMAPIVGWVLNLVLAISGRPGQMAGMMLSQAVVSGGLGLILAAAMAGDWRHDCQRHWTHWLGAGMRLLLIVMLGAYYTYYAIFPGELTRQ